MHAAASCGKATWHFSQCSRISKGMAFPDGCSSSARPTLGCYRSLVKSEALQMIRPLARARFQGITENLMNFEVLRPGLCARLPVELEHGLGIDDAAGVDEDDAPALHGRLRHSAHRNCDRKSSKRFLR